MRSYLCTLSVQSPSAGEIGDFQEQRSRDVLPPRFHRAVAVSYSGFPQMAAVG
ncbi:hypothetical protein J6590_092298, partial [Homalodisca vitripennis]